MNPEDQTQAQPTPEQTQDKPAEQAKAPERKAEVAPSELGSQKLSITVAQWQADQAKLAEYDLYKQAEAERAEKKDQEKLRILAEKEGAEKALASQRDQLKAKEKEWADKYSSLHQSIAAEKVDAAISQAIVGKQFIGQTPEVQAQAAQDFMAVVKASGRFSAVQDSQGAWSVRETATGRDAKEVLAEVVKAKSYLFRATTQGGVDIAGGNNALNEAISEGERQHQQWMAANRTNNQIGLFPASSRN